MLMRPGIPSCVTKPVATYVAAVANISRPLCRQARENVLQIGVQIMPIESRRWIKNMIAAARLPLRSEPAKTFTGNCRGFLEDTA